MEESPTTAKDGVAVKEVQLAFRVPENLKRQFHGKCVKNGTTMNKVLLNFARRYIRRASQASKLITLGMVLVLTPSLYADSLTPPPDKPAPSIESKTPKGVEKFEGDLSGLQLKATNKVKKIKLTLSSGEVVDATVPIFVYVEPAPPAPKLPPPPPPIATDYRFTNEDDLRLKELYNQLLAKAATNPNTARRLQPELQALQSYIVNLDSKKVDH